MAKIKNKKHLKNTTKQSLKTLIWLILAVSVAGIYHTHQLLTPTEASAPYDKYLQTFPIAGDRATSTMSAIEIVVYEMQLARFEWPDYLLRLTTCENREHIPDLKANAGNYPADSVDRGLFAINSYWHSEVSDECAFDPACSARWTMWRIRSGYQHEWVCDRLVRNNPEKYAIN